MMLKLVLQVPGSQVFLVRHVSIATMEGTVLTLEWVTSMSTIVLLVTTA